MTKIAVILGSVRPNRAGASVAEWVASKANGVEGVQAEILDLAAFNLPIFAEELPPMAAPAKDPAAVAWNEALAGFDAFIIVSPEYNHSVPGGLKNAIDFITPSVLANRAVGLVGYSYSAGHRQIEHLRAILANFTTGVVSAQVNLHLATDFPGGAFAPAAFHDGEVPALVEAIVAQDKALASLR
ncbi:NAD(P)H-dependent FMN reductase [Actinomyces denticolens]|uniref:NAD(P)H-dependent FMN reductase n=1 Tax=Actinomyces denticolens TaxID=52767 RepID=A0ABY1IFL1_9ACTO|nr:NAD(P)H-dependent oxidoreductase [Actinomyces denticolens]SHJ09532.1 NAD(P)H-dependent FMN reductase [Actinomyces denticolens]